MPLEAPPDPIGLRVADLNRRYQHRSAFDVLDHALADPHVGRSALVSSFGAESVVLLHMVSVIDRTTPILFIDTEMLFPETIDYQRDLAARLELNVETVKPSRDQTFLRDGSNRLHQTDPDACCALRKSEPLERALEPYEAWITGRKRYQGGQRVGLDLFEDEAGKRIKINPLAHWGPEDLNDYITNNRLPRHPLQSRGYPSIGCAPCTTRVAPGEDPRAGRWRGFGKDECGIHFDGNGKVVRTDKDKAA
ncbi:MAG: phosphoadenylyl-sulfate reductase [Silicimonas sp.]|nr:phosphoadenylyl-sulfate reductase [Silicimonas sp.]